MWEAVPLWPFYQVIVGDFLTSLVVLGTCSQSLAQCFLPAEPQPCFTLLTFQASKRGSWWCQISHFFQSILSVDMGRVFEFSTENVFYNKTTYFDLKYWPMLEWWVGSPKWLMWPQHWTSPNPLSGPSLELAVLANRILWLIIYVCSLTPGHKKLYYLSLFISSDET